MDHVISLGSGPDILRPLYDFPHSQHIHLVDSFKGWGESEAAVRAEILARLKWLDYRGEPQLLSSHPTMEVWRVEWGNEETGLRVTDFYFHQMNYNHHKKLSKVVEDINGTGGVLAGVLVTGAPLPRNSSMSVLHKALRKGGYFIHEAFSRGKKPPACSGLFR